MSLRSYVEYGDQGYTPGELARMSVKGYDFDPMKEQEAIAKLRYEKDFKVEDVNPMKTDHFEKFLMLTKNPEQFTMANLDLPDRFVAFQNFAGGSY
jgi:hypothetical protein